MANETLEEFIARKSDPNWQRKYRKALRGYIPAGLTLPGERPQRRLANGRFA